MKILALGGAGDMGRMAVTVLLSHPGVSSVTIADRNYNHAKKYVELTGSDKLFLKQIDVTDKEGLLKLISEHDLLLNTVGPYFLFGRDIMEASILAQRNSIDICDDWKPMSEVLDMDEKARKAGVTAIVGMGSSPGILNLMAVRACSRLDEIDEIVTAWGLGGVKSGSRLPFYVSKKHLIQEAGRTPPRSNAAIEHFLYECTGNIPTFKNGRLIEIEALTEAEPFSFPGYKDVSVCHIGHPEPVTLPRTIKANTVSNVMFYGKAITDLLRVYSKKISSHQMTITETAMSFEKEYYECFKMPEYQNLEFPPVLSLTVTGLKEGKRKKIAIGLKHAPYGQMAGITGVPMAIAAIMLMENEIKAKGVITPESSIDPDRFFNRYAPYCGNDLTGEDVLIERETYI